MINVMGLKNNVVFILKMAAFEIKNLTFLYVINYVSCPSI